MVLYRLIVCLAAILYFSALSASAAEPAPPAHLDPRHAAIWSESFIEGDTFALECQVVEGKVDPLSCWTCAWPKCREFSKIYPAHTSFWWAAESGCFQGAVLGCGAQDLLLPRPPIPEPVKKPKPVINPDPAERRVRIPAEEPFELPSWVYTAMAVLGVTAAVAAVGIGAFMLLAAYRPDLVLLLAGGAAAALLVFWAATELQNIDGNQIVAQITNTPAPNAPQLNHVGNIGALDPQAVANLNNLGNQLNAVPLVPLTPVGALTNNLGTNIQHAANLTNQHVVPVINNTIDKLNSTANKIEQGINNVGDAISEWWNS